MMNDSKWRDLNGRFFIPRGTQWSASRGFFADPPKEERPFIDSLKLNPFVEITIVDDWNNAYVLLGPASVPGQGSKLERVTRDEYSEIVRVRERYVQQKPLTPEFLRDHYIAGPGPLVTFHLNYDIKPSLAVGERGLVLESGIRFKGQRPQVRIGFEAEELRSLLFLWDRLDWPLQSEVTIYPEPDVRWLIDAGIMQRSPSPLMGTMFKKEELVNLHLSIFENLEQIEPGRWAVAGGSRGGGEVGKGRGLLVEMHNVLLLPDAEVPFEDILNFKEKRRDELLELRSHLLSVTEAIGKAHDHPAVLAAETEALLKAVQAQARLATEAKLKHRLKSLRTVHSTENLGEAVGNGLLEWAKTGDIVQGAIAAGGALGIKAISGLAKRPNSPSPLRYIFSAHQQFKPGPRTGWFYKGK